MARHSALALAMGTFMQVLDSTIANVSLPTIAGNLGVSSDQGTWVITAFAVAMLYFVFTVPLEFYEQLAFASCCFLIALLFILYTSVSYWAISRFSARLLAWAPPSQRL